jgi:hypothetical protein
MNFPNTPNKMPGANSGAIFILFLRNPHDLDFDAWRAKALDSILGIKNRQLLSAADDIDDSKLYRYMNIYQIEDLEQINESFVQNLIEVCKEHTKEIDICIYRKLSFDEQHSLDGENSLVVSVGMTPVNKPDIITEFHNWYTDEHIGYLKLVPGWRSASRYSLLSQFGSKKEYAAPFVAVHQYDEDNGLGGEIWKLSVTSPWSIKIQSQLSAPIHRRVWKLEQ